MRRMFAVVLLYAAIAPTFSRSAGAVMVDGSQGPCNPRRSGWARLTPKSRTYVRWLTRHHLAPNPTPAQCAEHTRRQLAAMHRARVAHRRWVAEVRARRMGPRSVAALIQKLAPRYGVSVVTALRVGRCESGLNPRAYNRTGCGGHGCGGVFQHHMSYWAGRSVRWLGRVRSVFDAYANVYVTIRMVQQSGWGAWSCY